jgi:hypothetical protein
MYNEFDIINNFMINLYQVDVCSTNNLDLSKRYYDIDGAYLRTGHKVLLVNQNDPIENDIYTVDTRGYLILSDELADTGRTWRYKAYVKLGGNKGKQFHLKNSGNRFPLKGEKKYFLDGHGYIIKNLFNYDLFDTGPIMPKIVFTDYELARISVNKNYELYNGFTLPSFATGNTIDIQYHEGTYLIKVDNDTTKYIYSGVTSGSTHYTGSTIYNINNFPTTDSGTETYIEAGATFCTNAFVYDYIKFEMSGYTNMYLKTFIKRITSPYIIISDYIPDDVLNDFYSYTGTTTYTVTDLMYSPLANVKEIMLESFYSKYFSIDDNNLLYPIENVNNRYFDYDGIKFVFNGITTDYFTTNNHYIKFQLYEHLNEINSYLFNSAYTFLIDYSLPYSSFDVEYYDERPNYTIYPMTYGDIKGTLVKVIPKTPSDINYFQNHTYVNIITSTGKYKTLIVDLVPNKYMVLETYKGDTGITSSALSIDTIYNLQEISNILYDVYINDETPTNQLYYRVHDDDMRRNICNGYAAFISEDLGIISNVTAFLMQDVDHKFVLKIYDPENYYNGGVTRSPYVVTKGGYITTSTSAQLPGEVINDGGTNITAIGMYYSTNSLFQNISVSALTIGLGPYSCNAYPLVPETTYYYKAFARNNQGESQGEVYSFTTEVPVYTGATVVTNSVSTTSHVMTINAEVIDNGYCPILTRGFIYQTGITTPNLSDNVIVYTPENGLVGAYQSGITNLVHSQIYSYNSYVVNICGTTYGNSGYTSTLYPSHPSLDKAYYQNVTYNSIDVLGNLLSNDGPLNDPIHGVDELGIVWTTGFTSPPTVYDNVQPYGPPPYTLGPFTVLLTGLTNSVTYYFRAYAINTLYSGTTTAYGELNNVSTLPTPVAPTVTTSILSIFTYSGNTSNTIVTDGGSPILSKGLYYATGTTVTISDPFLSDTGTTNWQSNLTGLTPTTLYSVMAKATNAFGIGYSSVTGFTTLPIQTAPTVTTTYITSTPTGATITGNVTSDGYSPVTLRGIWYSGTTIPGWLTCIAQPSTGTGTWNSSLTGLTALGTYYARAFAINSIGTTTGNTVSWTTPSGNSPPSFTAVSPAISNMQLTTTNITNEIFSDGGASVTSRGIMYSGTTIPSLLDWYGGTGSGSWITTITGLTAGGTYYTYAYATNLEGTTYTPSTGWTTSIAMLPTVIINNVTNITITGATINSNVTSDGFATVTARGTNVTSPTVLWASGTGVGAFSINVTGLTQGTSYTGISYATNSVGTANSNSIYFNTLYFNDVDINLVISSVQNSNSTVFQVGTTTTDIVTNVSILNNNIPISQLWSGNTTFTWSSTTGLTWGTGVTSATNAGFPYTYTPTVAETQNFAAIESCGTPSEIISENVTVEAVYPFLTCNRSKYDGFTNIPNASQLAILAGNGSFYTGNMPIGYEPMNKVVETYSSKTIFYNIGAGTNVIYFAYPSSYGALTKITVWDDGVPTDIPLVVGPGAATIFTNVTMASQGLTNNWTRQYEVYAFMVGINDSSTATSLLGNIYVEYTF